MGETDLGLPNENLSCRRQQQSNDYLNTSNADSSKSLRNCHSLYIKTKQDATKNRGSIGSSGGSTIGRVQNIRAYSSSSSLFSLKHQSKPRWLLICPKFTYANEMGEYPQGTVCEPSELSLHLLGARFCVCSCYHSEN